MSTPKSTGLLITACAAGAALVGFAQQAPKQLTARELFYTAAVTKPSVPRPQAAPQKSSVAKTTPPAVSPSTQATPPKSSPVDSRPVVSSPSQTSAPIITASDRPQTAAPPETGPALGLRYTILKRTTDGEMREVPVTTEFHAKDKIQVKVEANIPGYLYIILQGSSGTWKPMFPSPEVEEGNNRVDGWRAYTMPPRSVMTFDEQKGTEKLFIILSREPEPDLEKMIYSLQGGATQPVTTPDAPVAQGQRHLVQYASANIQDSVVGRLRNVYSRDLIIEKVDPNTPGDRKETAVYVVNPSGSTSSRVVADLSLVHQ